MNHQKTAWGLFILLGLFLVGGPLFLAYDAQESETRSFLSERPWAFIELDIGWATPVYKDPKMRSLVGAWQFSLQYPDGYTERRIIPEHFELCEYHGGKPSCKTMQQDR